MANRISKAYTKLVGLSKPGIFALVNEIDRRVFISPSTDILKSCSRIFNELKFNKHGIPELVADRHLLDIVLLEENDNKILRLSNIDIYAKRYSDEGYTFYRQPIYAKYEWHIEIKSDWVIEVSIKSSFGTTYKAAIFKTMPEAKSFIEQNKKEKILRDILKRDGRL